MSKFEHGEQLPALLRAQTLDVGGGPHEPELLGTPECEAESARRPDTEAASLPRDL